MRTKKQIVKYDEIDYNDIIAARENFALKYVKKQGWNLDSLSVENLLEIRSKKGWIIPKINKNYNPFELPALHLLLIFGVDFAISESLKYAMEKFPEDLSRRIDKELSVNDFLKIDIKVYMEVFTEEEINDIVKFYSSKSGMKFKNNSGYIIDKCIKYADELTVKVMSNIYASQEKQEENTKRN